MRLCETQPAKPNPIPNLNPNLNPKPSPSPNLLLCESHRQTPILTPNPNPNPNLLLCEPRRRRRLGSLRCLRRGHLAGDIGEI